MNGKPFLTLFPLSGVNDKRVVDCKPEGTLGCKVRSSIMLHRLSFLVLLPLIGETINAPMVLTYRSCNSVSNTQCTDLGCVSDYRTAIVQPPMYCVPLPTKVYCWSIYIMCIINAGASTSLRPQAINQVRYMYRYNQGMCVAISTHAIGKWICIQG